MKYKVITGIMLTLLLVSMLTVTFNMPSILADTGTAELSGGSSTVQEADGGNPSNLTGPQESLLSEGFNRNASAKENPGLYSVDEDRWNFNGTNEWTDFAKVDDDSAELVIGVNNGKPNSYADIMGLIDENGGDLVGTVSMGGEISAVVTDIPLVAVSSFVTEMRAAGLSRYIEPNIKFQANFVPNDPYWPQQWGPRIIEADYAWNTTLGDPSILVAVIDTGIDWNHPDLAANYVPLGYDWVNNDPDPMDDEGHGTHCAGIMAAVINNSVGVAGLAQVQIMAEKGLDQYGGGYEDDLANAIIDAVDQGAHILSNSWGGYGESELIHEAVKYAYDHGVLVIAAAGNDATSTKLYPAAYDEVIAVTATDEYDNPAWFPGWWGTNFGEWVELAAPGVDIYSTVWDDSYTYMSGTSMATPHVAGVAALILSQFPNMTRDQVRLQLRFTADDLGDPGFDDYYGYGRINARRAVEQVPPDHDLLILDWERPRFVEPGGLAIVNTTVFNFGTSNETNITVQLLVNGSIVDSATIDFLETATSETVNCTWAPMVEGMHNLTSYVLPVTNETLTANNFVTAMVRVGYFKYVLFDQTHGTDSIVMYNTWVTALTERGYVVDVHTTGSITSTVLVSYEAFIIPQAHYIYTSDELSAIQNFVVAGGGLLVIGDDDPYIYTDLTGFAGITWSGGGCSGYTSGITPHPVTEGVTTAYFDSPVSSLYVSDPAKDLIRDPCGYIMLAASETGSGKVLGIADEHSINDYYIGYADNFQLAINMIDWLAFRPEHDLVVTLDTPPYVEPGESSLLNVTVHNRGLSNETDVELFLLINGTIVNNVTIPELVTGSSYKLGYLWTPVVEAMYNVTGYAVPVQNETITENNLAWAYVYVGYVVKAFVLHSAGTYYADIIANWEALNTKWYIFGSEFIYIDYTTLDKDDITYDDIAATGADVLIISCASDPWMGWEFTDLEIEAITRYVMEGHGLIATAGTLYYQVPNNNKLAPLFGLNETITWYTTYTDLLHLQDPTHPLFVNVPNPYTFPQVMTASPSDGMWNLNELAGGTYLALGHYQESAIVVYRGLIYISPWLEIIPSYYHFHLQLLYNAIAWSSFEKPEHELIVHLESPPALKPGNSAMLNATVSNRGLSNETGVELQLLINGTIVDSVVIPELLAGSSFTLSYLWTPTVEGTYNVTAYAPPLPDEEFIENNVESVRVIVSTLVIALFKNVDPWDYPSNEEALSLCGVPYLVFDSNDFGSINLSPFSKVVIASDQDQAFYDAVDAYRWWFADYVSSGGVLEIHAADWGWHGGGWIGDLPGGLQWVRYYSDYVTIVDPTHPVVTTPNPITDAELDGWSASVHGYFGTYPTNSDIVIIEDSTDYPAYLEFQYGAGFIVASSQTLEWAYWHRYSLILENSLLYFRYPHELAVFLEAPAFLQPGDSSILNAIVYNLGLNNETNVELYLLVNGTVVNNVTIPELLTGSSYTLSYLWTPTVEATYNATAYAPPVAGENVTANNVFSKMVRVRYLPRLLVVDTPYPEDTGALDTLGYEYTLVTPTEFATVDLYQYNILFIGWLPGDALVNALLARASEIADWVAAGNGIVALAEFDEVNRWAWLPLWVSGSSGFHADTVHILNPSHPVMSSLTDAELSGWGNSYHGYFISYDPAWEALAEGVEAAQSITLAATYGAGRIAITDQDPDYHLYYGYEEGAGKLLRNMIEWAALYIRYEHEIVVSLDAPSRLTPCESVLLNATVHNRGLSNETDVELQLLINGTIVDSVVVPELVICSPYTLSYLWHPTIEGIYNVTAYARPVPGENVTANNVFSKMVRVRYVTVALISDHSELLAITPILDSMGIGYDIYIYNDIHLYTEELDLLLSYQTVIFYTDYRHITSNEYSALESYLTSGGNLLVTGFDSLVSDDLLRDLIRSATMGDNVGEPDLYVVDETHPIMNGPYGSFPAGYHISGLYSDCDAVEADIARNAITVAELWDGYDKIIATEGLSGKVVYWNGRGDQDWMWNMDCGAMLKNTLAWFAAPMIPHDVAIISVTTSATEVYEGQIVNITVVAKNEGNITETFNVATYYDTSVIGIQTVTNLTAGANVTLTFSWDTTGVTPSITSYTIKAVATPVPGETDTPDNTYVDGSVKVKMLGDVNGDGIIDIMDVLICAIAFGSEPGDPNWDPRADLFPEGIGDKLIDIYDLVIIGVNFGERLPEGFPRTTIYVDPQSTTVTVGETFTVNVKIYNVTDLMAFEYKLKWNSTLINCTSYTKVDPVNDLGWGVYFVAKDSLIAGQHWFAIAALMDPTTTAFTGSVTLATYTFKVISVGSSILDLADTKLGNSKAKLIPHDVVDGYVAITSAASMTSRKPQEKP